MLDIFAPTPRAVFLFVTGAGSCLRAPELISGLLARGREVYSVATAGVEAIGSVEALMDVPGNRWIRDYGEPPLDVYPFGSLLVAPCTFNTFNKIAHGVADNLTTAMIADGLGAGLPVVIAPSMNSGLWAHPQRLASQERLRAWGCTIVEPTISADQVAMAATDEILTAVAGQAG